MRHLRQMAILPLLLLGFCLSGCGTPSSPLTPTETAKIVITLNKDITTKGRDNSQASSMVKGYRIRITGGYQNSSTQIKDAYFIEGQNTTTVSFDVSAPATYSIGSLAIGSKINGNTTERTVLGYGHSSLTVTAGTTNVAQIGMNAYSYDFILPDSVTSDVSFKITLISPSLNNVIFNNSIVELFYSSTLPTEDCIGQSSTMTYSMPGYPYTTDFWYGTVLAPSSSGKLYFQVRRRVSEEWDCNGVKLSFVYPCISDGESLETVGIGDTSIVINPTW